MQRIFAILFVAFLCCLSSAAQDIMRVTGKVSSKDKGAPLFGVNITDADTKRVITSTDEDGRFAIDVRSNTTLVFSMIGADKVSVKVKGRSYLEVQMEEQDVFLSTATAVAKRIVDKVQPEATDIEIKGNYFYVRTRVRVPREMFAHDTRLVVQPLLNNVTKGELRLMRPMVYDARTYNRTQQRMYDFDMAGTDGDPLARYVTVKADSLREKGRTNDIIGYSDSIYVEQIKDEYSCDVYMAIENYNHILYRDTTIIARGTVNPLRWLDYSLASSEVTDSTLFPKAEKQMRDSKGQIDLRFPVGRSRFDVSDSHNAAEVEKLRRQIQAIAETRDATLQALSLDGTASPDGRYRSNLRLANARMDFALNYLRSQVPESLRTNMRFTSQARVASWTEVAGLMKADGLKDEAVQVEALASRYRDVDAQSRAARKLPFYSRLLEGQYLPRLRSAGYTMNYSIFRQLTIEEIRELYAKDYRQLSRYEFFQLYRNEADDAKREHILRQALEMYPSFMVGANDLQALLIREGRPDATLLRPFAGERAPEVVNANHVIALLSAGQYASADSIAAYIPASEQNRLLLAVNGVLNGRYKENFVTIANTGKQNELLMLLAMKRNKEALDMSKQLPDDKALSHYLRAVCLNRAEQPVEAYTELKKALKMDPSLEKTARIDGDVNDLLLDKTK